MKCQILYSGENKKNIINLVSTELSQRIIKANITVYVFTVINSFQTFVTFGSLQFPNKCLACWVKFSADDILKYFSQKTSLKYQSLF